MAKKTEHATELEYLHWFALNADFGPADDDVVHYMQEEFEQETGKKVPKEWARK